MPLARVSTTLRCESRVTAIGCSEFGFREGVATLTLRLRSRRSFNRSELTASAPRGSSRRLAAGLHLIRHSKFGIFQIWNERPSFDIAEASERVRASRNES